MEQTTQESPFEPNTSGTFTLGAGYSNVEGFLLNARLAKPNVFDVQGLNLSMNAQLSEFSQRLKLSVEGTPALHRGFLWGVEGNVEEQPLWEHSPPNGRRIGGQAYIGTEFAPGYTLRIGARLESNEWNTTNISLPENPPFDLTPHQNPRTLTTVWSRFDYRSEPLQNPATAPLFLRGTHLVGALEYSAPTLGSDYEYAKAEASLAYGLPLPGKFHFQIEGRAGLIVADDAQIPLWDRYHQGGTNPFGSNLLPRTVPFHTQDSAEFPLGGNQMLYGRAVFHFPLVSSVGLYGFIGMEGGAVGHRLIDAPGLNWNASAIVGILWNSPIGPIRVGYSIPLFSSDDQNPWNTPAFTVQFGQAF